MYQKLATCPICNCTKFSNHLICEDYLVSGESFAVVQCSACELLFTNPRPSEEQLPQYYQSEEYVSHANKSNSLINFLYKLVRTYTLGQKVKLLDSLKTSKRILDFGCGTGDFLSKAALSGWDVCGYEPNKGAREAAEKKLPEKILPDLYLLDHKVDIITAWHVIEHVPDLLQTMKNLSKLLTSDGYLLMAVPNHCSYDATFYQDKWAAYDVPRHLYHFDQKSVATLAQKLNLKLHKVLPMKFDSFYVSMLSEKNKENGNLLRALRIGQKSNHLAKKTGEYSSLIYILKK